MDKNDELGLSDMEAREILAKNGPNEIFRRKKISFLGIARHEVTEPMILLLLFVGVVYSIWGGLFDAVTIFVIIALLVIAEVYNEYRAKNAIAALELIAAPGTRVIRGGRLVTIDSREVVPGDLLVLVTGTKIAADSEVIRSTNLQCDESTLTGESFPVEKKSSETLYAGTNIVSGEGTAKVLFTGKKTRLGQIAATAEEIRPPKTALQLAMKDLAGKTCVHRSVLLCRYYPDRYYPRPGYQDNDSDRAFAFLCNNTRRASDYYHHGARDWSVPAFQKKISC